MKTTKLSSHIHPDPADITVIHIGISEFKYRQNVSFTYMYLFVNSICSESSFICSLKERAIFPKRHNVNMWEFP